MTESTRHVGSPMASTNRTNALSSSSSRVILQPRPSIDIGDETAWERVWAVGRQLFGLNEGQDFKAWQKQTVMGLARGECRFVIAPTGAGKSATWVLLLVAIIIFDLNKFIMVIAVTKAMQDDQRPYARNLRPLKPEEIKWEHGRFGDSFGLYALNEDTSSPNLLQRLADGNARFWTVTPEQLRYKPEVRRCMTSPKWRARLAAAYMDEAHTIHGWGRTFRPDLLAMMDVCEKIGSSVPWAFLSATMGVAEVKTIVDQFLLDGRKIVGMDVGCERDELFYDVRALSRHSAHYCDLAFTLPSPLRPVAPSDECPEGYTAAALAASPSDIPRMVTFIKTKKEVGRALRYYRRQLPPHLRHIARSFHAGCSAGQRAELLQRFKDGTVRVIFATEAFGLGCDVSGIVHVIQYGNAQTFFVHEQHIGRAGRGMESGRCTCTWLTEPATFGPCGEKGDGEVDAAEHSDSDSSDDGPGQSDRQHTHSESASDPHPLTGNLPAMGKGAKNVRAKLRRKSAPLYRLANPRNNECTRELRRSVLRPRVKDYIERVLGGSWTMLDPTLTLLSPQDCCLSCFASFALDHTPSVDGHPDGDCPGHQCQRIVAAYPARQRDLEAAQAGAEAHFGLNDARPEDPKLGVPDGLRSDLRSGLIAVRKERFRVDGAGGRRYRHEGKVFTDALLGEMITGANKLLGAKEDITEEWMRRRYASMPATAEVGFVLDYINIWRVEAKKEIGRRAVMRKEQRDAIKEAESQREAEEDAARKREEDAQKEKREKDRLRQEQARRAKGIQPRAKRAALGEITQFNNKKQKAAPAPRRSDVSEGTRVGKREIHAPARFE